MITCKSCEHLTIMEDFDYCRLLHALLTKETLEIPCDLGKQKRGER